MEAETLLSRPSLLPEIIELAAIFQGLPELHLQNGIDPVQACRRHPSVRSRLTRSSAPILILSPFLAQKSQPKLCLGDHQTAVDVGQ